MEHGQRANARASKFLIRSSCSLNKPLCRVKQQAESCLANSSVSAWDGLYDGIGHAERPDRGVILKMWRRG